MQRPSLGHTKVQGIVVWTFKNNKKSTHAHIHNWQIEHFCQNTPTRV